MDPYKLYVLSLSMIEQVWSTGYGLDLISGQTMCGETHLHILGVGEGGRGGGGVGEEEESGVINTSMLSQFVGNCSV